MYGASVSGPRLDDALIYRGTFGTGLFQCIYQPAPAHWVMLPVTLEWQFLAGLLGLMALSWPPLWVGVPAMLVLSFTVAGLQAAQARLPARHDGLKARLLVAALCYMQPVIRSWHRYRTRLFGYRAPVVNPGSSRGCGQPLSLRGRRTAGYWSEHGRNRTELLGLLIAYLNEQGWGKTIDSGWENWDVEVYCHPWTVVQIATAQEDHGGGRRSIRVRYRLRPSGYTKFMGVLALASISLVAVFPRPIDPRRVFDHDTVESVSFARDLRGNPADRPVAA